MAWRNGCQDAANSRPLFLTIYAAVIVGIIFSSLYVFSALYSSSDSAVDLSSSWLTSSSSSSYGNSPDPSREPKSSNSLIKKPAKDAASMVQTSIWTIPTNKMPHLNTFRLTKELVQQRVEDNVIIVTFGNYAFMDFILTWVKHLTDLGISNLLVGAMDTKLLEALYWKGVPVFDMGSHMSTIDVGWGSPTFHKMGREKVFLIESFLPFGFELLMCDTDMVWLKNPLPYLARYPDADVLTSTDQVSPTVVDDRLDIWEQVGAAYNIGIFHWRPTDSSKKLAKAWKEMLVADDKIWDQNGFNELIRKQLGPSVGDDSELVYAFDGNLKLGILPASIFCSGHTYFVQAMYQQLRLEPYAVHTTFQYAGTEGKRHRLREAMVFYDPPEYYDVPGGFLSFKPSIPKNLLLDGKHTIESHFSLVNYQMKQIRTALAVASVLKRTLVMPPLWCRLDRLWFGHPGVLHGSMTRQPFLCPLDHVFEVNTMLKELPENELGPGIKIREYSFLDNPSLPKQVKESWLDVQLCQEGSADCHAPNDTSLSKLRFPKNSSEETFKTVFSAFKDVKVIQFSSMKDAFEGFSNKEREEKFRQRMKRYVGIWCCVENHKIGHIYYDMYWDEKPGWKALPPQDPKEDHPPCQYRWVSYQDNEFNAIKIFLINCLCAIQQPLLGHEISSKYAKNLEEMINSNLRVLVETEVDEILRRCGLSGKMHHFHNPLKEGALAETEEISPASLSDSLKTFFALVLGSESSLPEFEQMQVPRLRSEACIQVARLLAQVYEDIYDAIMDPKNEYPDPMSLARHPPNRIRTILGL